MDQIKTGKFIAYLRKERGMTQARLAELMSISDKTVSKWERGAGLPEVSLMLPLCQILEISVNELLTGERLAESQYKQKAEENIMSLVEENKENKKKYYQSIVCGTITIIAVCALIMLASYAVMPDWLRVVLVVLAVIVAVAGIATAASLDCRAGYFECPDCGKLFVPSMNEYVKGYHTFTKRRLTCPECGKTGMCKHVVVR